MHKSLDLTQPGGLFTYQDTLDFLQTSYADAINAIAAMYGDRVIVQGLTGTDPLSNGWVVYVEDGVASLIPVQGGTPLTYLHLNTDIEPEQYADGNARNVYTTKNFQFTSVSGGNILFSSFKRLPYKTSTLYDALIQVKTLFKLIVNVENAVILSGCVISNVAGSNCDISAGTVLMDGEIVLSPAVANQHFPFWLKPDATIVTADPGGTNVKFDYETSQRYADVIRLFTHRSGDVVISTSPDDIAMFDTTTGLGKWNWFGWKLCSVLYSRSPIGYDPRVSNPGGADANVWDALYNTPGSKVGNNKPTLGKTNLPNVQIDLELYENSQDYDDGTAAQNNIGTDPSPSNPAGAVTPIKTKALGDSTPFDVRSGGSVIGFFEKI